MPIELIIAFWVLVLALAMALLVYVVRRFLNRKCTYEETMDFIEDAAEDLGVDMEDLTDENIHKVMIDESDFKKKDEK